MFERFTERARRTIFFARYEASQLGCSYIESEHLLLGLFREDKALSIRLLGSNARLEALRRTITERTPARIKISTSVDMPLSHECKRVLAYASEESERMNHKHIDTEHLLLGLLREEKSFAAQLLHEQNVALDLVRKQVAGEAQPVSGLDQWLAELEARGGAVMPGAVGTSASPEARRSFAIYASDPPKDDEKRQDMSPAEKLRGIRRRIDFIRNAMERAIASHEFEKARFYSEEERNENEKLRQLREQFNMEEPLPGLPLLWIEIIRNDRFSDVQRRCDDHIAEGAAAVWLLDPALKRAWTVTKTDGLREFKGEILRIGDPPLEMDLKKVFG